MKLVEITAVPPRGTAEYLERNQVDFTMHDDGTIDINQDFTATSSMTLNFPKINRVFGDFEMNMSEGRVWDQVMPFYVDGNCKINVGEGKTIKSSQIPQSTHGSGELTLTGEGILVLDDETMYSYSKQLIDMTIGGGLEFLPREWNKSALSVVDTVEGIPPIMENLTLLRMTLPNPAALKGFNNRIKSVKANNLIVYCTKDTPLLGLLKIKVTQMSLIHYVGELGASPQPLNQIMKKGFSGELDLFEVQEELIEAGYTKHAKR